MPGLFLGSATQTSPGVSLFAAAGSGGGPSTIGPNPVVSSIGIGLNGYVYFTNDDTWDSGAIEWYTDSTGVSSIKIAPKYLIDEAGKQSAPGLKVVMSAGGSANASDFGVGSLWLQGPGSPPVKGAVLMSDPTDAGSAYISSIRVSSINGQQPGGSAGPNPVVSSLNIGVPYTDVSTGAIAFTSGMAITDTNVASPGAPQYFFDSDKSTTSDVYGLVSSFASSITSFNIQQPFKDSTSFCLAAGDNGNAMIFTTSPTSTLAIIADPVVIPGNLQVSSINGQQPGGSAGPNPSVSSIAFGPGANIDITNTQSLTFVNQNAVSINLVNIAAHNSDYTQIQIVAPTNARQLIDLNANSSGVSVEGLSTLQVGSQSTLMLSAPEGIFSDTKLFSISSLSVSSINGAAPGGGGASFSTLAVPGGSGVSTFNLVANQTNTLVAFSTIAGHVYTASVVARGGVGAVSDTDTLLSEIVDATSGNEIIGSWPLSQVSTLSGGTLLQQVGGSVTWKAGGTGAFFSLYPTVDANARVDSVNLIDYGAI